ncbi:MAG: class I SAM-dependent methyltransferase, partial [Chloroflexaceae bacterium]
MAELPPQWRYSLQLQVDRLMKVLPPGARVLEIGCGEGLLLDELRRRGLRVTGIEPSIAASAAARSKGLDVHTGYFPGVPIEGPFDAVVMSHVLEHLSQPIETLVAIDRLLNGGYVLLIQTNWRGLIPRICGRRWYAWVPDQHFWHFTPRGLMQLFQPLGWRTRAIDYS